MTEKEARLILDVRISRFDHAGDVNEALEIAKQALEEIQQYREIGTVERYRVMAYKMKPEKPIKATNKYSNAYACPCCGYILIYKDETGWFCGRKYKFCPECAKNIDWSEKE